MAAAKVLQKARDARIKLAGGQDAYEEEMRLKKKKEAAETASISPTSVSSMVGKLKSVSGKGNAGNNDSRSVDDEHVSHLVNRHHNMALLPTSQGVCEYSSLKGIT